MYFVFEAIGHHRNHPLLTHSLPTLRSSELGAVTALGATARNGRPRRSLGRLALTISCQSLGDAGRRLSADAAEHRLAGDAALAEHDLARRVIGQIDVDAAAEPDEADPLPRRDDVAGLGEGDDAARDQPGDLGEDRKSTRLNSSH